MSAGTASVLRQGRSGKWDWITLVGVVLTLGFPALPLSRWENEFASVVHLVVYDVIWWAVVATVLVYVLFIERRSLVSVGFRAPRPRDLVIAVLTGIGITGGLAVIYFLVLPALHLDETQAVSRLHETPFWWRFISVIRAAFAEELLFRGYALERLQELTGSVKLAAIVTCSVFAAEHVGVWGLGHLLIAGFGGMVLTLLYVWRRNLWVNMVAHFIVDGVAVLLG
jgi:membrane protease YdiL (CAAX protease family)